jgi:hypothetical protein
LLVLPTVIAAMRGMRTPLLAFKSACAVPRQYSPAGAVLHRRGAALASGGELRHHPPIVNN